MASGKPPFDNGPDPDKTVIRPNPGGRRLVAQPETPTVLPQHSVPRPTPAPGGNVWGSGPITSEPPRAAAPQPLAPAQSMDFSGLNTSQATGNSNPILEAATPLLILLANVRIAKVMPQISGLMGTVAKAIEDFEAAIQAKGIPADQVRTAKYVLCATADDIVQNLPSTDRLLWTQYSMLSRFFQTRDSGIGFFDELSKLRQNPQINQNLLSLMHACMSLGFEGRYRTVDGDVALQQIRRDVYQTMRTREPRLADDISPHWRGQDIAAAYVRRAVPLWVLASCCAGLMFLSFVGLRWLLGTMSETAEGKLAIMHPATDINIQRAAFKPFVTPIIPQSTQLERIRGELATDIAAKKVSADYAGKDIVVRLLSDSAFDTASAKIQDGFLASLKNVAATLDKETGQIRIVGHTDNTLLLSTLKFKDNQDLSEKRAASVAALLVQGLKDPARITTQGMADKAPIDPANTPVARAKNRRVEIFIPREDKT